MEGSVRATNSPFRCHITVPPAQPTENKRGLPRARRSEGSLRRSRSSLRAPTNSAASKVTKQVRQVLVQHRGKLTVVLNPCLDTPGADGKPVGLAPVELARFEEVYHVTAWALQGKVQRRHVPKDGGSPEPPKPPRLRRVVLTRSFPGLWALSVFVDDDQRYELVHTMEKKPSDKLVLQLCARLLSPETSA